MASYNSQSSIHINLVNKHAEMADRNFGKQVNVRLLSGDTMLFIRGMITTEHGTYYIMSSAKNPRTPFVHETYWNQINIIHANGKYYLIDPATIIF